MTRARLFLASFLLAAAAVVWIAAAPAASSQAPAFGTDVQIEPSGKPQGGFSIRVKVTNLSSGAVVAAPHLLVPAGENGETQSDLPDKSAVTVSAKVDATGRAATYSIALKKGERVQSSHTAKVNLP
jgi:hypothetical protein